MEFRISQHLLCTFSSKIIYLYISSDPYFSGNMHGIACDTLEEIAFLDRFSRETARDVLEKTERRTGG